MGEPRKKKLKHERAAEAIRAGEAWVRGSLFGEVLGAVTVLLAQKPEGAPLFGHVSVANRSMLLNPFTPLAVDERGWAFVIAHLLSHLAFDHERRRGARDRELWSLACELSSDAFVVQARIGSPPPDWVVDTSWAGAREEEIYDALCADRRSSLARAQTLAGAGRPDQVERLSSSDLRAHRLPEKLISFETLLASGIRRSVAAAVEAAAEAAGQPRPGGWAPGERVRRWVMSRLPALGALAAEVKIVAEREACDRLGVPIAAVDIEGPAVYLNPSFKLEDDELRHVFLHQLLHIALLHGSRRRGREPWLWNVACCAVVDGYLDEMGLARSPGAGSMRPLLERVGGQGGTVESLYDVLAAQPRLARGARGPRGDRGDMLLRLGSCSGGCGDLDADAWVRSCLAAGLSCPSRGLLPAGLVEEIEVLFTPPVAWDVELGRWMDGNVPFVRESRRSYARASRRQGATPDIPRPALHVPQEWRESATFGVVLDTSGSMDPELLGRALGAIASFAEARGVDRVRLVSCDASPHDHGFVEPSALRGAFAVKGRGGTALQPGIGLLLSRPDLPRSAPVMILTDGYCEEQLFVPREHCFVLPRPLATGGDGKPVSRPVTLRTTAPVFRVLKEGAA